MGNEQASQLKSNQSSVNKSQSQSQARPQTAPQNSFNLKGTIPNQSQSQTQMQTQASQKMNPNNISYAPSDKMLQNPNPFQQNASQMKPSTQSTSSLNQSSPNPQKIVNNQSKVTNQSPTIVKTNPQNINQSSVLISQVNNQSPPKGNPNPKNLNQSSVSNTQLNNQNLAKPYLNPQNMNQNPVPGNNLSPIKPNPNPQNMNQSSVPVNQAMNQSVISEGKNLYDSGKYDEAYPVLKSELQKLFKTGGSITEIAKSQNQIGLCCWKLKKYEEAIESYKNSLATWKIAENSGNIATLLSNLGFVYNDMKNYNDAVKCFEEGYVVLKTIPGIQDKKNFKDAVANTGCSYENLGNYEKAIEYFQISADIEKAKGEKNFVEYGRALNKLALTLVNLGRQDEAAAILNQAYDVLKEENGVIFSHTLVNQGLLLSKLKKHQEAFDKTFQALEIRKKYPENILDLAVVNNNLGVFAQDLGKFEDGIKYHEEALKYYIQVNPENVNVACSYSNMGYLLKVLNRLDEASIYYENCLEIRKKVLGEDHALTKNVTTAIENLYKVSASKIATKSTMKKPAKKGTKSTKPKEKDEAAPKLEGKIEEINSEPKVEVKAAAHNGIKSEELKVDEVNSGVKIEVRAEESKVEKIIAEENNAKVDWEVKVEVLLDDKTKEAHVEDMIKPDQFNSSSSPDVNGEIKLEETKVEEIKDETLNSKVKEGINSEENAEKIKSEQLKSTEEIKSISDETKPSD